MVNASILDLGTKEPLIGLEGKDLEDTPEMEKLTEEMSKLSSVANRQEPNWNLVEQCSRVILRDYVKHFQVACYYGQSLLKIGQGLVGIVAGAYVYDGICKNFWQNSLPPVKRKKGRFNSISFWVEQISNYLESYNGEEIDEELIKEAVDIFTSLDNTLYEIDEENAPNLRSIITLINRLPVKVVSTEESQENKQDNLSKESEKTDVSAVKSVSRDEGTKNSSVANNVQMQSPVVANENKLVEVSVPDNATNDQKLRIVTNLIVEVADDLFKQDLYESNSYRLRRESAWLSLKSIPYNENNVTRIPAPNEEIKNSIEKLFLSNQYESVIKMVEPRITQYLYWLDLSYYSWKSLVELKKEAAAQEISICVSSLVKRFKGIENLCFDDGTSMCSNDTKTWILGLSENCESNPQNLDTIKSNINSVINQSVSNIGDSLLMIENLIKSSHGIDKLRYETVLAYIFAKNKRTELSVGIIQDVLKIVEDNQLASWNSTIGTEIYGYAFEVFKLSDKIENAQKVLTKLAKLSPTVAITKTYVDD